MLIMAPLRIAVATGALQLPLRQSIQAVHDLGANGIQLDARNEIKPADLSQTGRRELLHRLHDLNLYVASVNFPARRALYDLPELDARLAAARQAMEFAYELGAKVITIRIGRIPENAESEDYGVLRGVLNDLARHGNRVGTTLAITPSRDSAEALSKLLAAVTEGPAGVNFDPAAFLMGGHEPTQALRALHKSVAHFVIRDAVRDVDAGGVEVPVGRGEVDWDEFIALVGDADYRGWLTVDRTQGEDKRGDLGRAIQFLRQIGME
jgi:sugar phosphate isomerase/epimerase